MAKDFNKDTQERLNLIKQEEQLQRSLQSILSEKLTSSGKLTKSQQELTTKLLAEESIADKLLAIQKQKSKVIKTYTGSQKALGKELLTQLETAEELLTTEQGRKKIADELIVNADKLKDLNKGITKDIKESLGYSSELADLWKAGGVMALGAKAFTSSLESMKGFVSNTAGAALDMYKTMGLSAGQAVELSGEISSASFSMTGLLYGSDAVAASAKGIVDHYGMVGVATSGLIEDVTKIAALTGDTDSAIVLASAFEDASGSAGEMTDEIKDLANKSGVSANKIFKSMSAHAGDLVGKSEAELKIMAKANIELIKRGTTMEKTNDIASSMLDFESSMKAAAKARIMLGRDVNDTAVRSAAIALKAATTDEQRAAATTRLNDEIMKGVGSKEDFNKLSYEDRDILAATYGMTRDDLATRFQSIDAAKKAAAVDKEMTETYGVYAEDVKMVKGFMKSGVATLGQGAVEAAKLAGEFGMMRIMDGKNPFGGLADGAKSAYGKIKGLFGKGSDLIGKDTLPGGKTELDPKAKKPAKASQGAGKGLKSLAGGLKAMGSGKVLAGIFNTALAGPALIISLPAIPFLLFMGKSNLKSLYKNFSGLGRGLAQMAQAAVGALVLLLAIPALALGMLAIPFLAFMSIPGLGPAISANFMGLAAGLAAFGNPATAVFVLIGIGLLALLGAAMIPFAYSLSLLSPLVEAFGNIFIGVFAAIPPIITAVADGLVNMMNAVTMDNVGAMLLLGPALMGVAFGLAAIGMMGIPGLLALTGLGAITVLLAPTLMGIADSIGDMMSGGSEEVDSNSGKSDSKLIDAINGLRGDIQSQPIMISIDGKVVSEITKIQNRQGVSKNGYRK